MIVPEILTSYNTIKILSLIYSETTNNHNEN